MKTVQIPPSDNWLDAFIESLQDSQEAADYLTVILEDDPEKDQILRHTLKDIIKAKRQANDLSEEAMKEYEKIEQLFAHEGGEEIYTFIRLLKTLGFCLKVEKGLNNAISDLEIPTANEPLNQEKIGNNNSTENDYQVQRFLRWFEKEGENLVGETLLNDVNIQELQTLFNLESNNPMYDCYLLENQQQFDYLQNKLNISLNNELYDYYLETDALNIIYSICLLVNLTQGAEGGYLLLEETTEKPDLQRGDTITKRQKVPYQNEFGLGNKEFDLDLTLMAIEELILEDRVEIRYLFECAEREKMLELVKMYQQVNPQLIIENS